MKKLIALLCFLGFANTAVAGEDPCKPEPEPVCYPKPKPKKRKWRPRKKIVKKCDCPPGEQGPQGIPGEKGDKGDKGDPGEPGTSYVVVVDARTLHLGVGYMAAAFQPTRQYAWAHGPSLRLTWYSSQRVTSLIEMGFMPGRKGAYALRAGMTRWLKDVDWLGFGGSVYGHVIGTDANADTGQYLALVPHAEVRTTEGEDFALSLMLGPAFAAGDFGNADFNLGVVASGGIIWRW